MPVKVADIHAVAFVGGGLLLEAVPDAATYAAQDFSPRLFAEIIRQVYKVPSTTCAGPPCLWAFYSSPENSSILGKMTTEGIYHKTIFKYIIMI
jgi:hypothetical protein